MGRGKMASLNDKSVWDEVEDGIGEEVLKMSTEEIVQRTRLLDSEIKIMKSEVLRVTHELQAMKDKIKENTEKIKVNKTLPYLVPNVIELLDVDPNDQEEDGANIDLDSQRKGKSDVIKTSTRQTYFLPVIGLVDAEKLKPGDLVGVNKDSYLVLEKLPTEFDSRVKAMEVDERPTEQYSDIGGLDKQIQELIEAVVLPMTHKDRFVSIGIQPPKGVLMYGPPGTGKTLLARACAAQTKSTFLKLAGPQLVQMFIGDGAKLVRDAFALTVRCNVRCWSFSISWTDSRRVVRSKSLRPRIAWTSSIPRSSAPEDSTGRSSSRIPTKRPEPELCRSTRGK